MKTVLRVCDGKGDRHATCINLTAALRWHRVLEVVVDGTDSDH
jgi:hypothetical protein